MMKYIPFVVASMIFLGSRDYKMNKHDMIFSNNTKIDSYTELDDRFGFLDHSKAIKEEEYKKWDSENRI